MPSALPHQLLEQALPVVLICAVTIVLFFAERVRPGRELTNVRESKSSRPSTSTPSRSQPTRTSVLPGGLVGSYNGQSTIPYTINLNFIATTSQTLQSGKPRSSPSGADSPEHPRSGLAKCWHFEMSMSTPRATPNPSKGARSCCRGFSLGLPLHGPFIRSWRL